MHHAAGDDVEIPAQQVDLGQRQVLGADHHGDHEIADGGGHRRHQEEEDHDDAVHGEHLVIGVGGHQVGLRRQQFQADEAGQRAADKEEERDRDQVERGDPLVVAGEQPAQQAVLLGQEVHLGNPGRGLIGKTDDGGSAHGLTSFCAAGAVARGRRFAALALRKQIGGVESLLDAVVGVEILDVLDQRDHAFFADLALVGGHDGRVALGDVLRRVQNRLAQISVVGGDGLAGGERRACEP